jgi:hypothetical protein
MNLKIHRSFLATSTPLIVAMTAGIVVAAEPSSLPAAAPQPAATDQQIAEWVAELDSNQYRVREAATQQLVAASAAGLDPLLGAANSKRPEPADRAVWIMRQLVNTTDIDLRQQVLEHLVRVENRPQVVEEAKAGLAEIQHQFAVRAIEQLGGHYLEEGVDPKSGQPMPKRVVLDDRWRGGDAGLENLTRLRAVPLVTIIGTELTAKGLAQLASVESLRTLQLYGTRLEDADVTELQKQFGQVKIDYRRGGLLGVRGAENSPTAEVQSVQPNSAAAAAGILQGDTIQKIDGKTIADFAQLTSEVAKHRAGDEIALEVLRGKQTLEVKVKLGKWESP